jgi:hypothetical protein
MEHELTRFPPVLQLVALGLLAFYVLLSILGRLSDRFEWMWDRPDEVRSLGHVLSYTVTPALMLFAAGAWVVLGWKPEAPLTGGWTVRQLTLGPLAALAGLVLVALATTVQRRGGFVAADPGRAWFPLVALLVGMALMAVGIMTFGRTVKQAKQREQKQGSAAIHPETG